MAFWKPIRGEPQTAESIYLATGDFGTDSDPDAYRYDVADDAWNSLPDAPTGRDASAAIFIDGVVYVMGGETGDSGADASVEGLDVETETWASYADMPQGTLFQSATELNGNGFIFGGQDAVDTTLEGVQRYRPEQDEWDVVSTLPEPRLGLASEKYNESAFLFGGSSDNLTAESNVWEYDPFSGTITSRADMPTARFRMGAAGVNERIHVVAGVVETEGEVQTNAHEVYNAKTDEWDTNVADAPAPVRDHGVVSGENGLIYVIGGRTDFGGGGNPTNDVYAYDYETDTWTQKNGVPSNVDSVGYSGGQRPVGI